MSNRWLRFVIALLAIVASVAAGFRISQLQQQLVSDVSRSRAGEAAAQNAIESLGELKAALHAYVAPGQNQTLWTSRVGMFTDKVRNALLELDGAAAAAGAPVSEAIAMLDRLGKSEQRARNYLTSGQTLLAGDVIFTDARDLLDGMRGQVAHARGEIAQAAGTRQGGAPTRAVDARAERRRDPRARRARAGAACSRAGIFDGLSAGRGETRFSCSHDGRPASRGRRVRARDLEGTGACGIADSNARGSPVERDRETGHGKWFFEDCAARDG